MATEYLNSPQALASVLTLALSDADLVTSISEMALEHGLTSLAIGKGIISAEELKDKLFLTREEATKVIEVARTLCAGVAPPAAPADKLVSMRVFTTSNGRLSVRLSIKERAASAEAPAAAPASVEELPQAAAADQQGKPDERVGHEVLALPTGETVVVIHRASAAGAREGKKPLEEDTAPTAPAPTPSSPAPTSTPSTPTRPASAPPSKLTTPSSGVKAKPSPLSRESAAATPSPRPKSALPASCPRPAALVLSHDCGLPSPASCASPASASTTPSYLRPTAATKARMSTEAEGQGALTPRGSLASVPEHMTEKQLARRRNLFARMASTLLAPTQAFMSRVTGRNEEEKSKKEVPLTKASLQLSQVLSSPQGQRVTRPAPFQLRAEMRPKSCVLSKEELDLIEAKDKAFRRNAVPKHVHEARPIVPSFKSTPKEPQALFEPFNLASLGRHAKQMEVLQKKQADEEAREDEARRFKARQFDSRLSAGPITPPKPAAPSPTKGTAPVFASEARIAHYHEVIEPVKKAKEAEANKEKLEAERRAKELEDMSVDDFRKTLEFKATKMPDFSSPFRPDPALARPVTVGSEPRLHTVGRLGPAPSPRSRQDKEGDGLGAGVYNGEGYIDPWFANLRKSTSVMMGPGPGGRDAMRRSTAVRASASSALGSRGGLSVSVGSALQAAIRAAAQDAARDLAAREAREAAHSSPRACGAAGGSAGEGAGAMASPRPMGVAN